MGWSAACGGAADCPKSRLFPGGRAFALQGNRKRQPKVKRVVPRHAGTPPAAAQIAGEAALSFPAARGKTVGVSGRQNKRPCFYLGNRAAGRRLFLRFQGGQQAAAAVQDVAPGGLKVAGIPRVGHLAGAVGVFQQQVHLARRVAAAKPPHVVQVFLVHADQQVPGGVVGARQAARGLAGAADAVLGQLALRGRVDRVADLLAACRSRGNLVPPRAPGPPHQVLHHKLRHRAAADVAVANK